MCGLVVLGLVLGMGRAGGGRTIRALRAIFTPAPHRPLLDASEVERRYPAYRWRVLEATFLGYASYYLVRNNLPIVGKQVQMGLHYTDSMYGNLVTITALTYGLGKFLMGGVSDRSNARRFMALGLLLTAGCNFAFGAVSSYRLHLFLWGLNGFVQGMGWPPCGRCMAHWFSEKERGLTFSMWNTSHNLGGGVTGVLAAWSNDYFHGWQYAFFVPGVIALFMAAYLLMRLVDTPQSVGLPPIEEYKNDLAVGEPADSSERERELRWRELFLDHVLLNRAVWLLALGNFFAYICRYVMIDWGPKYLQEVKHATVAKGGFATLVLEFGGIPSTILLGYISDRLGGRRGMIATLCMLPILAAFTTIMLTPPGHFGLDLAMLCVIGFCIYPVINLIVIMALDLTSKKAIGAAAGFIGLLGYLGKAAQGKLFGGMLDHYKKVASVEVAWTMVFYATLGCGVIATVCLALTWNQRTRPPEGNR